ncbi:MAG: hypothetical protein R6W76_18985 [Caldilinea sp.]
MSSQSTLDRFKEIQITSREFLWVLIGAVAGLVLGLLIGWVWWPVDWQGGDASTRDAQIEYLGAVADAYAGAATATSLDVAQQRLARLGDDLPALFDEAVNLATTQPDGAAQVNNLAMLASALGIPVSALPAPATADTAPEGSPATTSPASSSDSGSGLGNILLFLFGAVIFAGGLYALWRVYQRGWFNSGSNQSPAIGPLGQTLPATPAEPIDAYAAGSTSQRSGSPAYSTVQAAATKVSPVQPPAMGDVPPFEPDEPAAPATPPPRASSQSIAPSLAVSAGAAGAFTSDDWEDDDSDEPVEEVTLASPAGGQRSAANSISWIAGAGRLERYPTIDRFEAVFTAGMQNFDCTQNIPGLQEGVYLGEYGIGVSERHGMLNNDPDQVVAIEVYIFDKSDEKNLVNVNRVVLSEYADTHLRKHFEREKDRLGPIVAQPNTALQLEARQFVLLCTITDVVYTEEGIFKRVIVEMELKKKA